MRPNALLLSAFLCTLLFAEVFPPAPIQPEKVEKLLFDGQYRGRFESYSGVNKVAYGDAAIDASGNVRAESNDLIYLQQLIAGLTYRPSADWEFKAYMYDARSWGSSLDADDFVKNPGTSDEYRMSFYDDQLELFEAYGRKYNFLTKGLRFTLGRQQLGYGDKRIFGPGKWGNTMGWLWDAAHFSYRQEKNFIDLWYGQTRTKEPHDFSIKHKHLYQGVGLYGHYETDTFSIEPFFAWRNTLYHDEVPNENACYYGLRLYRDKPGVVYDATGVKGVGTYGALDIDSYAYALKAGYLFDNVYAPKLLIGSVYASGDTDPSDSKKETFSTPFGLNDGPLYGRMDIMFWSNMQDYQASFSFKPLKKLSVESAFHRFELAQASDKWYLFGYKNKPGNTYTHIGDEYDLILKYRASKNLELLAIASYLEAGDFITENAIAHNDASKLFFQFLYTFSAH